MSITTGLNPPHGHPPWTSIGRRRLHGLLVAVLVAGSTVLSARCPPAAAQDQPPLIAAAASLRFALDEIIATDRKARSGTAAARVAYGATGTLVRQIEQGAPFEIFLSADTESPARLAAAGLADGAPIPFARGRLALVAAPGSPVAVDARLDGLKRALAAGEVRRFAIPNPELAPYGVAAREALRHAGLLEAMTPRLVLGENVAQAAQFVASRAAEAGIVSLSLAGAGASGNQLTAVPLPVEWHRPINQSMVLLKRAGPAARALFTTLQGPAARETFVRHGFAAP